MCRAPLLATLLTPTLSAGVGAQDVTLRRGASVTGSLADGDTAPEPWEPDAAALEDLVGRYFSEEIETFYGLVIDEDRLVIRQRRMDDVRFERIR